MVRTRCPAPRLKAEKRHHPGAVVRECRSGRISQIVYSRRLLSTGLDLHLRRQGPVHGAAVGDLQQALLLLLVERSCDLDFAFDPVEHALGKVAGLALRGMDLGVFQANGGGLERPTLAVGVHAQRHRGAGAEGGHQQVERCQQEVGRGIPRHCTIEIHLDDLGTARLSVMHFVSRELRITAESLFIETAAGADEIADGHPRFEGKLALGTHSSATVRPYALLALANARLRVPFWTVDADVVVPTALLARELVCNATL